MKLFKSLFKGEIKISNITKDKKFDKNMTFCIEKHIIETSFGRPPDIQLTVVYIFVCFSKCTHSNKAFLEKTKKKRNPTFL